LGRETGHPAETDTKKMGISGISEGGKVQGLERKNKGDEEAVVCSCPSCDLQEMGEGKEVEEERW
jgi:hypothetical protein